MAISKSNLIRAVGWGALFLLALVPFLSIAQNDFAWVRNGGSDNGQAIAIDGQGNVFVTGATYLINTHFEGIFVENNGNRQKSFTVKYNSHGQVVWVKNPVGVNGQAKGFSVHTDKHGNCYIIGMFRDTLSFDGNIKTSRGYEDIFIAKYSPNGDQIWVKGIGGSSYEIGRGLTIFPDGYLFIAGIISETLHFGNDSLSGSHGGSDAFLAKLDTAGNFIWARRMGGGYADHAVGVCADAEGNAYVTRFFTA